MAWIILEGLDRTGKSTVAEIYKKKGFHVVHMSAPDKKYMQPGYAGPSYLDDLIDIYMTCNARNIVFDRSPYGETVWPFVYGRKSQLTEDDFEVLQEFENNNQVEKYLLYDGNTNAHWKRCVDNKEPLDRPQFNSANTLFERMANKYGFVKKELKDFVEPMAKTNLVNTPISEEQIAKIAEEVKAHSTTQITITTTDNTPLKSQEQLKLEKANAINDVLSKRILKNKGVLYDEIENEIRTYLNDKLGRIFGTTKNDNFSNDEMQILKMYCSQIKKKLETK
jgi:hypothetical protein